MSDEVATLVTLMRTTLIFNGSNTDLASALSAALGRDEADDELLEAPDVSFESRRSNAQKYIRVKYVSPQPTESASSDSIFYEGVCNASQL